MKDTVDFEKVFTQAVDAEWLREKNVLLDVLRLDLMHTEISGNKWFKLKYYLQDAVANGFETVATFGGAYSNHILAAACACEKAGIKSIGIIRGEEPDVLSHTLTRARQYGMQLHFISRADYKKPEILKEKFSGAYWINEGGYGAEGVEGAKEIMLLCKAPEKYSHVICAVGTGTMMAGIIKSVNYKQFVMGISVMKGNLELINNVEALPGNDCAVKQYSIVHDYHFGGYAKHPAALIEFMNQTWKRHHLPTDIIYTAKTFYAVLEMVINNTIPAGSSVLMIHSGGLQGNLSLPAGTLCF